MKLRSRQGRRTALGLGLIVAGAVTFVGALPGYASGAQETEATTSSSLVEDNPTCSDLAPEGTTWTELKVEPVADGPFGDGTLSGTIDVRDTDDGPVFDWTSNIGVDAVFVKGGPVGGLLYVYDPESTGDTGLHAPVNPQNGKFSGLSHVSFCYDKDQGTTTTTEKETTTTTAKETTTTTAKETTTTEQGVTTTTAGETTTTAAGVTTPTTQAVSGLPRTGSNSVPLLVLAAVLLGTGVALVAATRRFRNT